LTDDLYIGSLGLSPLSVNITSLNDGFPSLLGTLSEKGIIPSESYGYLAGAYYYGYPISAYGSLTFGGYDSTRLDLAKNLTLAGGSDAYRPILLGIESITSDSETLLSESIITALDSLVSQSGCLSLPARRSNQLLGSSGTKLTAYISSTIPSATHSWLKIQTLHLRSARA